MKKSVELYMEQGLDRKMAEYFASGKKRIVDVVPNNDFSLTITFDNGERRIYDVTPFLKPNTLLGKYIFEKNLCNKFFCITETGDSFNLYIVLYDFLSDLRRFNFS